MNSMLTHQVKVIVNPMASGGVTRIKWMHIKRLLDKAGLKYDYQFTEGPDHATELARDAVSQGYRQVIAVGGDGTIHEVVNGLIDKSGRSGAVLGIISTGTGNDFARSIGTLGAYHKTVGWLAMSQEKEIDVGIVEYKNNKGRKKQRIFVNMAGAGFDAAVLRATKKRFRVVSHIPYWISGIYTYAKYKPTQVTIDIDGKIEKKKAMGIIVNNGYSFAGGMRMAPGADMADGLLDTVVLGDINPLEFIKGLSMVYKGTLKDHPKVDTYKAKSVAIDTDEPLYLQADGELLGQAPAVFRVLPRALRIAVYSAS
jgi:YegS/Rv2252/BmrU family lipid kinase